MKTNFQYLLILAITTNTVLLKKGAKVKNLGKAPFTSSYLGCHIGFYDITKTVKNKLFKKEKPAGKLKIKMGPLPVKHLPTIKSKKSQKKKKRKIKITKIKKAKKILKINSLSTRLPSQKRVTPKSKVNKKHHGKSKRFT